MNRLPQRLSLPEQVVQILREDLRAGRWTQYLPSEAALAEQLQVSRCTLRTALAVLQREGCLAASQGRRRQIVSPAGQSRPAGTKRAVLLMPPWHALSTIQVLGGDQLRVDLRAIGWELAIHIDPTAGRRTGPPGAGLRRLVHDTRASVWILGSAREEVQQWFKDQRLLTLVFGSTFPSVGLPALDLDFRAVCRHAVGTCLRLGHRRIALLQLTSTTAGLLAMEQGFQEGFAGGHAESVEPVISRHDGSVAGICRALHRLFRPPAPPTALIVPESQQVLTVLSHLHQRGLRVPADVGVVALEFDWFLRDIAFSLAHYEINLQRMASRLARLAVRLATTGTLPARQTLLMPRFVPGDSLAPRPTCPKL